MIYDCIHMTELVPKIKRGSLWLAVRFLVCGPIGIVSMPLIVRGLSVEEYGIYNILFALLAWISMLSGFGLDNVFQRFIPEALQRQDYPLIKALVKKGMLLRLVLSSVTVLIVFLFSGPIGTAFKIKGWERYFLVFAFGIICVLEQRLLETALSGLFMQKYTVIANVCWSLCRVTILIVVVILGKGLVGILITETVCWLVWLGLLLFFYRSVFLVGKKGTQQASVPYRRFLRYGGFSFFSEVGVNVLDMATDLFVIVVYLGPAAAGIYGFCDKTIKMLRHIMPHSILRELIRPVFFARYAKTQDTKELEAMFNFLTKVAAFFLIPLAVGMCVLGQDMITYIFGEKYLSAYVPLCIVVGFYAANAFVEPTGFILQSLEKVNILFYSKVFAIYNLIGDLLVVKPFGVVGVALVTSSAVLFKNLFCLYFARRYTGMHVQVIGLFKIGINAVIMGGVLFLLRNSIEGLFSFVLVTAVGSIAYFVVSFFNKAFTKEERHQANQVLPVNAFQF